MTHGNCAYTRLIYASPLYGNQRVEESNLAAWVFETPPKGTLLAVRDSAKLRAIQSLQPPYVVTAVLLFELRMETPSLLGCGFNVPGSATPVLSASISCGHCRIRTNDPLLVRQVL